MHFSLNAEPIALQTNSLTTILGGGSLPGNKTHITNTTTLLETLQNLNTGVDCTVSAPCEFNMRGRLINELDCPAGCYANRMVMVVEVTAFANSESWALDYFRYPLSVDEWGRQRWNWTNETNSLRLSPVLAVLSRSTGGTTLVRFFLKNF